MNKPEQQDLLKFIQEGKYQNAFICTYSFEIDFFENYCLDKFQSLNNTANINVLVDYKIYNKILDNYKLPELANTRYLLLPVKLSGAFHTKLFLFTNKNKAKLIIGSANFTEAGLTSNAELVSCFEFEEKKKEESKHIFIQAYKILVSLSEKLDNNILRSNLSELLHDLPWLNATENIIETNNIRLIDNTKESLINQIAECKKTEVKEIYVTSRFFDSKPDNLLKKIREKFNTANISIYTQNKTTTLNSTWLNHDFFKEDKLKIFLCQYLSENALQTLHAKAYAIEYIDGTYTFAFGSANFSTPALIKTWINGNLETLLLFENIPKKDFNPNFLFDVQGTKVKITKPSELITAVNNEDNIQKNYTFHLIEAFIKENNLVLKTLRNENFINNSFKILVTYFDGSSMKELKGKIHYDDSISVTIFDFDNKLLKKSCVVQLEIYDQDILILTSNKILITNLLDINTSNNNVIVTRAIKTVEEYPENFYNIFKNLIEDNDKEGIIYFFNTCNIKINPIYSNSLKIISSYSLVYNGIKCLKNLNFDISKNIHESAKLFIDRHIKKLGSHVKNYRGVEGITNFIQILLVILETINFMTQMIFEDLNSKDETIFYPDEWKEYKDIIYSYYMRIENSIEIFSNKYFNKIMKKNIKNLESILNSELIIKILNNMEVILLELKKIIELRGTKIFILNKVGSKIVPSDIVPIVNFNLNIVNHNKFVDTQINKIKEVQSKLL